ncbi:Glucose-6-phosphate isomerase [Borrelia duttonii CR2A]|uniref:Glucose-6-phosphate isomerase n=1 Tax=Borrelia duttonii CR2A TaxID=1432657 RepID=W6TJN6_9SPIR|nr:Glucose-6-phosphate isomerase [Borrelia duttonii CR2A]
MIHYNDLNKLKSFQELKQMNPEKLKTVLNENRIQEYDIKIEGNHVHYNYATKQINEAHLKLFQNLSDEANLIEKYKEIINGKHINLSENRKVLHHLTRGQLGTTVTDNNENMREFFERELHKIFEFAQKIQNGTIKNTNGKVFKMSYKLVLGVQVLVQKHYTLQLKTMLNKKIYTK